MRQPSVTAGAGVLKEFFFSGRLDNLCTSFCSLKALVDATSENSLEDEVGVRMVTSFDHEEVGSNSAQGAGFPVIFDALSQITRTSCPDLKDKHEENHQPKFHSGLVIKHNAKQHYAPMQSLPSSSEKYLLSTIFLFGSVKNGGSLKQFIPESGQYEHVMDFVVRNDGAILASGVGI